MRESSVFTRFFDVLIPFTYGNIVSILIQKYATKHRNMTQVWHKYDTNMTRKFFTASNQFNVVFIQNFRIRIIFQI